MREDWEGESEGSGMGRGRRSDTSRETLLVGTAPDWLRQPQTEIERLAQTAR